MECDWNWKIARESLWQLFSCLYPVKIKDWIQRNLFDSSFKITMHIWSGSENNTWEWIGLAQILGAWTKELGDKRAKLQALLRDKYTSRYFVVVHPILVIFVGVLGLVAPKNEDKNKSITNKKFSNCLECTCVKFLIYIILCWMG